jgi:hypothetical protein
LVMALLHSLQQSHGVSTRLREHTPTSDPAIANVARTRDRHDVSLL